ncbi:MAG: hypothetical protein LBI72_11290 [Flavobacteriaceae bacterium]|jgi:magnesium-transporting ATPase (P-type)|nr:hypothetical protein [Flavobacteriaceae bacterium]
MSQEKEIIIPLSKAKMALLMLICLVFVALGIWFVAAPPQGNHVIYNNPYFLFVIGIASIVLFTFFAILYIKKMFDPKPGLIINSQGIWDNATAVSAGLIPWKDIVSIEEVEAYSQKFILVVVSNPEEYLNKVTNSFKRKAIEANYKHYGTPISISANALKSNRKQLFQLLREQLQINK